MPKGPPLTQVLSFGKKHSVWNHATSGSEFLILQVMLLCNGQGDYCHGCQCKQNHTPFIKLKENQLNIFPFHCKNRCLTNFWVRKSPVFCSFSQISLVILHTVSYEVPECIKYYLLDKRQFCK